VFKPYVDKGEMQLLKGYGSVKANVVDCPDFAQFIVDHMNDTNVTYDVGGKETYTYEEMAAMCFEAAGKPLAIKWAPIWLFGVLANLPKSKRQVSTTSFCSPSGRCPTISSATPLSVTRALESISSPTSERR
jgi:nucleoside-diphosphate-sugar epimerase